MKPNPKLQNRIGAALAGLVLVGSTSLCLAASPVISEDFNTGITGWTINYSTGPASVSWNQTGGPDGSGCLQVTLTNGGAKVGPLGTMPSSYPTANYWKYEFDMKIDPTSGMDTNNNNYGNFQTVMRDASWSWDSHWFGGMDATYLTWKHVSVTIPSSLVKTETMLGFEVAASAGVFSGGDVIIYIDNLVISPMENPWVIHPFTNATEIATGFSSWSGGGALGATSSLDTTKDAGGGFTPLGSLKLDVNFDPTNSAWQEGTFQFDLTFDPTRYSSFEFDLWIDSTNAGGITQFFLRPAAGGWSFVGALNINSSYVGKWTHCSIGLGSVTASDMIGFVIQNGGGNRSPTTYYFDNLQFVKSYTPPSITKMANGSPRGVQIVMDDDNSQWQRNGISSPASMVDMLWVNDMVYYGLGPITYSFTLNDFPDPITRRGLEAHLFFVNMDTDPSGSGDYGNGAIDWNAADLVVLNLTAVTNANGAGYDFSLNWKTNLPAANPNHPVATVFSPVAVGTWGITFTTPTNATMTGPGGISTNVVLEFDPMANFMPASSLVQFGMFKNDGANDGHNNGASGTFARVQKTGGTYTFDDSFAGPTLTNAYVWRPTSSTAVTYVPDGTGKWLTWTLPADRFTVQVAPAVTGAWTDVTPSVTNSTSTRRTAAIPAASIPTGPNAFFRLIQKN